MKKLMRNTRRRGNVLLMVVSLLALLFVIVVSFLSLSRSTRQEFEDLAQGARVDAILQAGDELVLDLLRQQWTSETDGKRLANAADISFEDIPGYRGSHALAMSDPIFDPSFANSTDPNVRFVSNRWGVSSLEPVSDPSRVRRELLSLLIDFQNGASPVKPAVSPIDRLDLELNARYSFMDADGDGVPDSDLLGSAALTDIANAMAGISVRVPRYSAGTGGTFEPFEPSLLTAYGPNPPPGYTVAAWNTLWDQWTQFDELARYESAVRVVSHGGMVSLGAPTLSNGQAPWNRQFAVGMFNLINRDGTPQNPKQLPTGAVQNNLFDSIYGQAASIESALRNRGMLPTYAPANGNQAARQFASVPHVLRQLEGGVPSQYAFERTFDLGRGALGGGDITASWQRFNIADAASTSTVGGFAAWSAAARMNPTEYHKFLSASGVDNWRNYDRRHLITTISHSDDLARRLSEGKDSSQALNQPSSFGLEHGQTKFYLGEIADAFDAQGRFRIDASNGISISDDADRGWFVVRRLVDYYYDMLGAHDFSPAGGAGGTPTVSRLEQAWMLAVNTVAFAAPRNAGNTPGFIDTVAVPSDPLNPTAATYVGYAPQPFITQFVAYNDHDSSNSSQDRLTFLIELFNPYDPENTGLSQGSSDGQALWLGQFALRLKGPNASPTSALIPLTAANFGGTMPPRFNGRTFLSVLMKDVNSMGAPNAFPLVFSQLVATNQVQGQFGQLNFDFYAGTSGPGSGSGNEISVELLRSDSDGSPNWYVVDRMTVSTQGTSQQTQWHRVGWRDCKGDAYFGDTIVSGEVREARWRVAMGVGDVASDPGYRSGGGGQLDSGTLLGNEAPLPFNQSVSTPLPDADVALTTRFGPTIPLYTMNAMPINPAQRNVTLKIHGANRPESFPTPGFLLFVPRFSHKVENAQSLPISRVMGTYWLKPANGETFPSDFTAADPGYPADFGHMPVFSNQQALDPNGGGYLNAVGGEIPWGQLVFDYFTTVNPRGEDDKSASLADKIDDVDPLQIPGRININVAPWFVLSQLPIIGPANGSGTAGLPFLTTSNVAFRSRSSGVLIGNDRGPDLLQGTADDYPRFIGDYTSDGNIGNPNPGKPGVPAFNANAGWWTLGSFLGTAAASYRDRAAYVAQVPAEPARMLSRAWRRNSAISSGPPAAPYLPTLYGAMRGQAGLEESGFVTLGELANVIGFASAPWSALDPTVQPTPDQDLNNPVGNGAVTPGVLTRRGDFMKAVSLLALLDTHFLTTRSNTFTVYQSLVDRRDPQGSVRSQTTIDRTNLLPRLVHKDNNESGMIDPGLNPFLPAAAGNLVEIFATLEADDPPAIITQRRTSYLNARED